MTILAEMLHQGFKKTQCKTSKNNACLYLAKETFVNEVLCNKQRINIIIWFYKFLCVDKYAYYEAIKHSYLQKLKSIVNPDNLTIN